MNTKVVSRWIQEVYGIDRATVRQCGASHYEVKDKMNTKWVLIIGKLVLSERKTIQWLEVENDISIRKTIDGKKLPAAREGNYAYMYQMKAGSCEKRKENYRQLGAGLAAKHRSWHEKLPMNDKENISLAEQTIKAEQRQMDKLLPEGQTIIRQSVDSLSPVIQQAARQAGSIGFVFREVKWWTGSTAEKVFLPGAMPGVHVSLYDLAALLRSILLSFSGEEDYQPFARMVFNELLAGYDSTWSIPLPSLQQFANILEWHDLYQYALLWKLEGTEAVLAGRVREQIRLEHRLPLLEI